MASLWFITPVHGRLKLATVCLRQLRRTCDALNAEGVQASAVLVGAPEELEQLPDLGFATVPRNNKALGRKFNDGIQLATDPQFNPQPVDYVVPFGSDDWIDHRLFLGELPPPDTIVGFQRVSFVREDGSEISTVTVKCQGGSGIRIIPRQLVAGLGYRPATGDERKGCDTSILINLRRHHGHNLKVEHWHLHDHQIVDWKTRGQQLTSYDSLRSWKRTISETNPYKTLAGTYPLEALTEMFTYYVKGGVG